MREMACLFMSQYREQQYMVSRQTENGMSFTVECPTDAQITVELEEETSYQVFVDDKEVGEMKTNLGGKLVLSVELDSTESAAVRIEKM